MRAALAAGETPQNKIKSIILTIESKGIRNFDYNHWNFCGDGAEIQRWDIKGKMRSTARVDADMNMSDGRRPSQPENVSPDARTKAHDTMT